MTWSYLIMLVGLFSSVFPFFFYQRHGSAFFYSTGVEKRSHLHTHFAKAMKSTFCNHKACRSRNDSRNINVKLGQCCCIYTAYPRRNSNDRKKNGFLNPTSVKYTVVIYFSICQVSWLCKKTLGLCHLK